MKIGIFDSGHGGRLALQQCQVLLPQHEFAGYFDHANAPYGDRTAEEIYQLTNVGTQALLKQGCQLVLLACNTASAQALRRIQESNPGIKVLGCLIPAIETAIEAEGQRIGIIATQHTVETKKYQREAFKVDPKVKVFPIATPKLVPWIEAQNFESNECRAYLREHIESLLADNIDTLILGCTHYSVLKPMVKELFPELQVIDSAAAQAHKLANYLERHPELK